METGIPVAAYLGRHLGIKLVPHGHIKAQYSNPVETYRRRMEGRKSKILSFARRCSLVKSVINNLLIFQMQTSRLPSSVTNEIDKMVRKCIWVVMKSRGKFTWLVGITYVDQRMRVV